MGEFIMNGRRGCSFARSLSLSLPLALSLAVVVELDVVERDLDVLGVDDGVVAHRGRDGGVLEHGRELGA